MHWYFPALLISALLFLCILIELPRILNRRRKDRHYQAYKNSRNMKKQAEKGSQERKYEIADQLVKLMVELDNTSAGPARVKISNKILKLEDEMSTFYNDEPIIN